MHFGGAWLLCTVVVDERKRKKGEEWVCGENERKDLELILLFRDCLIRLNSSSVITKGVVANFD